MLLLLLGAVIEITGGVLSRRVTLTEAVPVLFEASVQLTVIVFDPSTSGRLLPLAKLHVGAEPELSVAV